jgi:hypothetical protein
MTEQIADQLARVQAPRALFRFNLRRYGRIEKWTGEYTRTGRDPSTETKLSVLAHDQDEAVAKAQALSGVYRGPSSDLFNGRESVNHGWVFVVDSADEVVSERESVGTPDE